MVVVLASAALMINPLTFHFALVMKGKAVRGWLGCLGNKEVNAALLSKNPAFPDALQHPGPFIYLVFTSHRRIHILYTPAHLIMPLGKGVLIENLAPSL